MPGAAPIHLLGQATQGRPPTEPVDPELDPNADLADIEVRLGRKRSQEPAVYASIPRADEAGP